MSGCKGSRQCGRGVAGSGYYKQSDSAKAKELDAQVAAALAARQAQDAKMMVAFTVPSTQTRLLHGESQVPVAGLPQ